MTKFLRRLLGCFFLLLVFSGYVVADMGGLSAAGMAWADSQDVSFDWIEISTNGTRLSTIGDDDEFYTVNLPFTFYYYNRPFNTVYVSSNGFLTFNNYAAEVFSNSDDLSLGQSPDSLIAIYWDDLEVEDSTSAASFDAIYSRIEGTAPYRKLIVEYAGVEITGDATDLTFEVILYETLNLIKFQYLTLGNEIGFTATVGLRYPLNTVPPSDSLVYSVHSTSLSDNLAILFYPSGGLSANTAIAPDTVLTGINNQLFSIELSDIMVSGDSLQNMGKADSVRINNPFTNNIIVTGVRVDGQDYFISNSPVAPSDPGFASWTYSSGTRDLTVLLPTFAVGDSITVDFLTLGALPGTPGDYNFVTGISSRLNPGGGASGIVSVRVGASGVASYAFIPNADTTIAAGDTIDYTLKALDQFGNSVLNNGSVNLSAIGSSSATFTSTNPVSFAGDSVLTFGVTDTETGDFNVRAVNTLNSGVTGQSGLIIVNPASPDTLVTLSSEGNIGVGTDRLLQVRLEDVYGNVIKDSLVTFELVSGGDGNFGGSGSTQDLTNTSGVAEASYTASTNTSFGIDTIRVSIGSVVDSIFLPLVSGPISSFDLTIQTSMPATAGSNVDVEVVARDQYNNAVASNDSVLMSAIGSMTAEFTPTDTFAFGGDTAVTVTVVDTVVETFSVRAKLFSDLTKQGTSDEIRIIPSSPDTLVTLSSEGNIGVGTDRLLQVRLEDVYGNVIKDSLVTFELVSSGDGNFGGSGSTQDLTNTSGVAEASYTASTNTSFGIDTIRVSIGSVVDSIFLPLVSGPISHFELTILTGMPAEAGDIINIQVAARDAFNNGVINSKQIQMEVIGSGHAQFIPAQGLYTFSNDSTVAVTVVDTFVETFSVRARLVEDMTKQGTSDEITIIPSPPDHFVKLSSETPITVGTQRLLQVRLEDEFDNDISGSEVTFEMVSGGNGNFVGSDSTPLTNSSGVAEALYTASTSASFGIDTIRVSIGGIADSIFLPLVSGTISHFDLTIDTPMPAAAGDTVDVRVVAKDAFNNGVLNSFSVQMNALGSTTAYFIPSDTYAFGGDSVVTISVRDTVVKTFSVRARLVGDLTKQGTSDEITIIPSPPDHFVELSSQTPITVGTQRLLQVRLEDEFDNDISGSEVTFEMVSGGNGNFVGSDSTPLTNSSGVAEVLYRASTQTSFGIDTIRVSIGGVTDSIFLPLVSGTISHFDLTILDANPDTAGSSLRIRVVARDLYDNPVVLTAAYTVTAIGSNTAQFTPANPFFSNDFADTVSVRDTTAGFFTVRAQLTSNPTKQGTSELIEITPASLDYLLLRSLAGNKGISLSGVPFNINSSQNIVYYAAGYDQFDNYIDDIDSTFWNDTGGLVHTGTFPVTASTYTFDPFAVGTPGQIHISIPTSPGIAPDTTGVITVTGAQLSYIQIQSDSSDGGPPVGPQTLAAGETDTLYAVGYDIDNNWLGTVSSNWSVNNSRIGDFQNGLPTINGVSGVIFTADSIGNGVITAAAVSDTNITDQTGLFTIIGGPSDHILIRNEANNGGSVYNMPLTVSADSSIKLYAAFYDAHNNYLGDSVVTWATDNLINIPTGPAASIVFSPTTVGSGFIYTISSIKDDSTGTITVVAGELTHIRIQNGPTGSAVEIDTVTLVAGEDTTMYAGGYDNDNNFRSLVSSNWSLQGDPVGVFSNPNPDSVNVLTGQKVGTAVVKATQDGGSIHDLTSTIMVLQGDPDSLLKVAVTDSQAGSAGQELPQEIEVIVHDAFGNPVNGDTVRFEPLSGGLVNGNPSFVEVTTNLLGIASVRWTLHPDTTTDSLAVSIPNYVTSPVTLIFVAFPNPGTADTLFAFSPSSDTGRVATDLAPFTIQIIDSFANPVPNIPISFSIISRPDGSIGEFLDTVSATTDLQGRASTRLHLGSKLGTYKVRALAGTTDPPYIDFTGVANQPDDPDTIIIVSGNNQTGTVAQPLADSIRFRVTDQFGNIVSNEPINFNALQGGSTNPAADLTDAGGFASTAWTLGNTSGTQQLVASLTNFPSVRDTVTATAAAGAASSLSLVTMRKLPNDSVAAVPGENITFVVEVRDQFNNLKPNATVRFASEAGYNALFESNQLLSDANGRVSNVVKTDKTKPETFFRAYITGVDTLPLHIFHIRYVAGSLSPRTVSPGDAVPFHLQLNNASPHPVDLSTNTIFSFDDGLSTFNAALSDPLTLPANSSDTLFFDTTMVDSDFTNTTYTPELAIRGGGDDSSLAGTITLPINSLSIFNVRIIQVTASKEMVARGETFNITMTVSNDGPENVDVDSTALNFNPPSLNAAVSLFSGPTQLAPNTPYNFVFNVTIPGNAVLQQYTVDGTFSGTTQLGGIPVFDGSSDVIDSFSVVSNADIAIQTFGLPNGLPAVVTNGDSFTFQARLLNSGAFGIILDPDSTYLSFGTDTILLSQSYSVPSNKSVMVNFGPDSITSLAQPDVYNTTFRFYGTENEAMFDKDTLTTDSVRVQNPPNIQVAFINIVPDTASQDQGLIQARVVLQNVGPLNATARISSNTAISLSTIKWPALLADPGVFPLDIEADSFSDTVNFSSYLIDANYPIGLDTARVTYTFSDINSGKLYPTSPPDFDTVLVQSRARLLLTRNSLDPDTVIQGQAGIDLRFTVGNTGQSSASIDSSDLSVQFTNPHDLSLTSPVSFPVILAQNDTQEFIYSMVIDPNSGTGWDRYDLQVSHTDVRSGKTYTDVDSTDLDSVFILTPGSASNLEIQFVQIPKVNVNRGQTGVSAKVRLKNFAQSIVRVDSLFLLPARAGVNSTLTTPALPSTISGGTFKDYNFTISVDDTTSPGPVSIDARYVATDLTSDSTFELQGSNLPDTINIFIPADFVFEKLNLSKETVSEGQTGIIADGFLRNGQSASFAPVKVDSLKLLFDVGGDSIKTLRLNPSPLPQLQGNDSVQVQFELQIRDSSTYLGDVIVNLEASGTDLNDLGLVRDTSLTGDTLTIQDKGDIIIDSVTTPITTATIGQTGIPVTVYFHNPGQALVDISSASLFFNNGTAGFFQTLNSIAVDPFTGNDTAYFTLQVLGSATPGPYTITSKISGVEQNTQGVVSDSIPTGPVINITTPGQLRALSVSTDFDSVSIGSQGVAVSATIANMGSASVLVDSVGLTFSKGTYTSTDTSFTPPLVLKGGSSTTVDFGVGVDSSNTPGISTINARVWGKDSLSADSLQDLGADITDTWRLVTAANLEVLTISPDSVSNGQNVTFSAQVRNLGQATVRYGDTLTYLNLNGSQVPVDQGGTIFGNNSTAILNFDPTTINFSPPVLNGALVFRDFTENGFLKSDSLTPVDITVFDSANVTLASVTLDRDTISQNMNLGVQVRLANLNANSADAVIDSIVIPQFGFGQSFGQNIAGNDSGLFELNPLVSDAFSGSVDFDITVYWHDRFIAGQNILSFQDAVFVLNKANIRITNITADTLVSLGQPGYPVEVSVTNTGEVQANILDINFTPTIGMYTITDTSTLENIPPGETVNYAFSFAVKNNSATGVDTISVNVSGEDSISVNSVQTDSSFSWEIRSPSIVQILSAIPDQSTVSQGQNNIPVKVIFENLGGDSVRIDSVFLHFSNGDSNYTGIKDTLGLLIGQNRQDSVEFFVSVDPNTQPRSDVTINAAAVGRGLITGSDINITEANVKGTWTVQQRPQIAVPLLSLNRDTVSTGQGNIVLTFRVRNNGGGSPTATAMIDSMHLVIDGSESDSTHFTIDPQFDTPINLVNNSSVNFNFDLKVQDTASSGVHDFQMTIYYRDVNDDSMLNLPPGSGASDFLFVQQRGVLVLKPQIQIVPDSAYIGQDDIAFTLTAKNTGEGKVQLNSADLILHGPSGNFVKSLQTFGFPFVLRQNDSIDVDYLVDVPLNINLPQFDDDTLIYAGGRLNGVELNSGIPFSPIQRDSLDTLTVVNTAHIVFDTLVPTGPLDVDTTVSFTAFVTNNGGSNLYLNANTRLRLVRIGTLSDSTVIPINPDSSDMRILPGESALLVFQERQLTQTGDFNVFLEIDGTVHLRPHRQTLTIPEEINIGGVLSLIGPVVKPSSVSPNQDSVLVSVAIRNIGPTLFIDSAQTVLQFEYDNGEPLLINSMRIDTLTKIPQNPQPLPLAELEWEFSVPVDARTGLVKVTAFLSFNGGTVTTVRSDTFMIVSGVEIDYVLNSLTPDSTVPGQNVSFLATFSNTGNTGLNLDPDSSYLQFDDGTRTYRAFVNGNLTIRGTQDSVEISVITFRATQINPNFIPDVYPATFVMEGSLPNLEPYDGFDSTFNNQLTVLEEANVVVDSIDIVPVNILAGQNNVEIQYYLSNIGNSPANISSIASTFRDSLDQNLNSFWIQVTQSPSLPLVVAEQGTALITRTFNVSPSIAAGVVRASLSVQYNDTLKPADVKTFSNPAIYDSVNVISPSSIFIDSLVLANVPNAGNGTVNYNQNYDLKLVLQNFGNDALEDIVVELRRNSVPIDTVTLADTLAAGDTLQNIYNFTAGTTSQSFEYWAVLLQAISVTSGTAVPIGQPIDNKEIVTIQEPSVLTLTASASDDSLFQSQVFEVNFQINRTGQSPIDAGTVQIHLPGNYILATQPSDSVRIVDQNNLSGSWQVIAQDTTIGPGADSIIVGYGDIPFDQNIGDTVAVTNTSTTIPVKTFGSGSVQVTDISIIDPPGAEDDTLSTGQTFLLQAVFSFGETVSQKGREAELILPANQGFFTDSTIKPLNTDTDSAIWQIRAPDVVTLSSENAGNQNANSDALGRSKNEIIELIQGELFTLRVIAHALDSIAGTPISSAPLEHQVEVQDRAELEVQASIVDPPGAIDGVISTEQSFSIDVSVLNSGEAQTTHDSNEVVLRVIPGFAISGSAADTILLRIPTGGTETVDITAPDTATTSQKNFRVTIDSAALDTNTNLPAFVSARQEVILVNVVRKASLRVDNLQITDPPGATDGTVSYGQTFTIQAVVNNTGQAGVLTSPQGTVAIELGDSLQLAGGEQPIKDFDIGQPVEWQVQAGTNPAVAMLMNQIHSLKVQSSNILQSAAIASAPTEQSLSAINERARTKRQEEVQNNSQISLLNQADRMELESVNEQLSQLYEQLSVLIDTSNITVRIETIPSDENTSNPAFVELGSQNKAIYIQERPFIDVADWQIRETWSTDQIDTVEAMIDKPDQVTITSASLNLPQGFTNLGMEVQGNLYRWRVRTPTVPQQATVAVNFVGIDQNSADTVYSPPRDTSIVVEEQTRLKLRGDVYSLRVSKNQKFTIAVTVINEGQAAIADTGKLELLPGQMLFEAGEASERSFTTVPVTLYWNMVAPDTNVNSLVTIRFKQLPLDTNTFLPVQLNSDSSQVVIDVNMIPKQLYVSRLKDVEPLGNYVQGSQNVRILGLGLQNAETLKPDTIYVDRFLLSVTDNDDQPITDLGNLISRVKIVNYDNLSQFSKPFGEPSLYADIPINASTQNPIPVDFSVLDTVTSGDRDKLVVLMDIAADAPNRNFSVELQSISAYQIVGANNFGVDVTDSIGNPLSAITDQFKSPPISVVSGNPAEIFGNYPNPFGLDNSEGTKFIFFMEGPGNVDLRVFTLLGELVWSSQMEFSDQGLKDGLITWDGYNDAGRLVLNGVYIAILKINYNSGGGKTHRTKVAFIK